MAATHVRFPNLPRTFRRIGFLHVEPLMLAISIRIRLRSRGRFVVYHDGAGRVFTASETDPRGVNFTRVGLYSWPCDREWIVSDLQRAFAAWKKDCNERDGRVMGASACP